jgi:hypothetical protein
MRPGGYTAESTPMKSPVLPSNRNPKRQSPNSRQSMPVCACFPAITDCGTPDAAEAKSKSNNREPRAARGAQMKADILRILDAIVH